MANVKPKRAWIIAKIEVDLNGWDDDVDWSDAIAVIDDQVSCVGIREACNTQQLAIQKICCEYEDVTYTMSHNKEAKGDE